MKKLVLWTVVAAFVGLSVEARAFTHPSVPNSLEELATIKANLGQQPWKQGYALLAADGHSQLTYTMQGPFANVSRKGSYDANLGPWQSDMTAVYNLARMWYFTGNADYAQKAHDILLAWATTHTSFTGNESGLALGDYAASYGGGASILRGTWPGWTAADTTAVQNYFSNVFWPAAAGWPVEGPANKGALYLASGMAVAVFCDNDPSKFDHVLNMFRTFHGTGLMNTLATGEMGETGRDAGHAFGTLNAMAFIAECAWKQGVDLYSELDNRMLACGEYYARNTFTTDNPYVPFGTIDWQWMNNTPGPYTANRSAFYILQNAYKNRKNLPTPWMDRKLQEQGVDAYNFMYAKTADFTTATVTPATFPTVSPASSGLTLTTLGTQTTGRSVSYANGVWTMTGLGNNVWSDTTDDCQFAYKQMTGDCAMVAKVNSFTYSGNNNGKAGLMIRDNLTATISQRAWVGVVPAATVLMESHMRGWTVNWGGGGYDDRSHSWPPGLPYWIKIERRDKQITTFASLDGTSWAALNCTYYGNLPSTLYIGLFLCSGTTTAQTATFSNVAFTGGTGGLVTTPAAPAGVLASASGKAITVRWLASYGATSYDLLRSTTSGSGYAVIASNLTATRTSYVDTAVSAGTTYYYVVQAKNSAGTSGNSPEFGSSLLSSPMVNLGFSGSATASTYTQASEAPSKAFDTDPGSKWFAKAATGWLQYDFGANNAQVVKRYTINSADVATRDPKDWTFQGSQDGSNWTTLDTQSGQLFAYRLQQNTYNIGNTTAYRYYRLNITADNGATQVAVAELGLWGDSGRTIPDGRYRIASHNSNKVIDVSGGATASGAQLVQWTYDGGNSQQWDIAWQGNGQYRATGVGSGKVIDNGGSTSAGANLIISPSSGAGSQLWKVVPDNDGFFHFTSVNSGLIVDVTGGSTAEGVNVVQSSSSGSDSQLWMPSLASTAPPAPTALTATVASTSQIDLAWTASSGATGYSVKRGTVSGGPYTTIATGVTATSYSDTGLDSNTTYYYVITATNDGGSESGNSPEAGASPQAKLQAWLKFDETSGTTAADASGNGWPGTLANGPTWVAGTSNNAVNLSGSSQYVSLPAGIVSTLNGFTVSVWVKVSSLDTWARVFDFGSGTATNMMLTTKNGTNGNPRFAIKISNSAEQRIDAAGPLPTGTWVHIAVTLSGSTGTLYINGAASGTNTAISFKPSGMGSTTQNYLGKSQYNDPYLNGAIDDFRIYTRALSAGEISLLAAGPLPAPQNVTATPGSSQIALSWNAVSNATGYTVQRASSSGGPYTLVAAGVTATSYTDSGLLDGATWYYIVTAQGLSGAGTASAPASATTYTALENWRLANFGSVANSGNAADAADPDGDGMTNAQEFAAGTDPNDRSSALRITQIAESGNDLAISFTSMAGKTYRVESSDTLQSGSWTTEQDNIAGTGGIVQIIDTDGATQSKRFYRVVVTQ